MFDRMHLLIRFQAIAEAGSLRKAAERLNITQPALSRSLKQLEELYQQPLLERYARGVRVTPFGEKMLSTISRIHREWEVAEYELQSEGSAKAGVLRLSGGPLWASAILPVVTTKLQRLFPNLSLEIGSFTAGALINALLEGKLDVAFGGLPKIRGGLANLEMKRFTTVQDRVIAHVDHPIQRAGPDEYDALHRFPWIVYASPDYEAMTTYAVFERTGFVPNIRVRSASLVTIVRLLQEGDYLCLLPDAFVMGLSGRPLRPASILLASRVSDSGAFYRKSMAQYEPLKALIGLCEAYFADLATGRQNSAVAVDA